MELRSGKEIGHSEFFKATHTKKDGSYLNKETEDIMEKANEKLAEYESIDGDEGMVETKILTQVIGKERHGRVRGLGLGPIPTKYYGHSGSHLPQHVVVIHPSAYIFANRWMESSKRWKMSLGDALNTFLQQQFPGGSYSQSQNQCIGSQTPKANTAGSSMHVQNQVSLEH